MGGFKANDLSKGGIVVAVEEIASGLFLSEHDEKVISDIKPMTTII